jgi:histidinol-phosphatase (PHP family)
MKIPHDYHTHTRFSEDGKDTLESMCRRALELGIPEIGFSEHWDVGPYEENPYFFQSEPWYAEIVRLRDLYAGQLKIRAGIEIAEPHLYAKEAAEMLSRFPFDYVIGSVHWVGPNFMFNPKYFQQHTADEVYSSYFDELERMVTVSDIDIVAHLDIPARTGIPLIGYNPFRYEEQVRRILEIVIRRRLALDINTAGFRKPANNLMPDPIILKWYAEMGGEQVTLGSDAHQIDQVGLHLDKALDAVCAAGLNHITQLENRQARLISIAKAGKHPSWGRYLP